MDTEVITLNEGWRFHLGECEQAWYKGYDDSKWQNVLLPHDWAVKQPFSKAYSSGTAYLAGGVGWYRLNFKLPAYCKEKCVRLVFDGVYKNSQVWCNSFYLGKRPNGFSSFSYDITPFIQLGEVENEVSVKVTHTDLADSRWYTGTGINRKVTLVIEEQVHPAENGILFSTSHLNEKEAEIEISYELINQSGKKADVLLETSLISMEGACTLKLTKRVEVDTVKQFTLRGIIKEPCLWSVEQPYLYTMQTSLSVNGKPKYCVGHEKVGIRSICFDAEEGFFLNEKNMKIKGVCLHEDAGCLGTAVTAEIWQRRLEVLKECGCNAIRCSHNLHMRELYELCDRMGLLVMDEAFDEWENAKNKWWQGHNIYPPKHRGYFEDFPQWHEADLLAMVRRNYNHPSVMMWSIGNEIDYPNDPYCHPLFKNMIGNNDANKPGNEQIYNPDKPNAERIAVLAQRLSSIVKRIDSTRPVTLASAFPELSTQIGVFESLDVAGYNYKEHLYEKHHELYPARPLIGSENGHSYEAWKSVTQNKYVCGQFLWTGIDYLGEAHGWPVHGSPAGLLDCSGSKKPEFYRRQSFWTKENVLYIGTRAYDGRQESWLPTMASWNYKEGSRVVVKCYSNLPQVMLYLNDKKVGHLKRYNEDGAYQFNVIYESGVLRAEAADEEGNLVTSYQLETTDAAEALECRLWKSEDLLTDKAWEKASLSTGYLYQLEITLLDKKGRVTVNENHDVCVFVSGAGRLEGLENGDLADTTSYSENYRRTHGGRLTAYIRRTGEGNIVVQAAAKEVLNTMCEMIL